MIEKMISHRLNMHVVDDFHAREVRVSVNDHVFRMTLILIFFTLILKICFRWIWFNYICISVFLFQIYFNLSILILYFYIDFYILICILIFYTLIFLNL